MIPSLSHFRALKGFVSYFVVALSVFILTACSFFEHKALDEKIKNAQSYRLTNAQCENLNLSSSQLTPMSFKSLLKCLNANGEIPEVTKLILNTSDDEVKPIVDFLNRNLLSQPQQLYQFDQTLQQLIAQNQLSVLLPQIGKILDNTEFVNQAIGLLKEGYLESNGGLWETVLNFSLSNRPQPNQNLLAALEQLSPAITPENASMMLEYGIAILESKAFQSLLAKYTQKNTTISLEEVTEGLYGFANSGIPQQQSLANEFLALWAKGAFWQAWEKKFSAQEQNIRFTVPRTSALLQTLFANRGEFFDLTATLFQTLNAVPQPIQCMKGTQRVVQLTPAVLMMELGKTPLKEFLLTLTAAKPFCDIPAPLMAEAQKLLPLSSSGMVADELQSWMEVLAREPEAAQFLGRLFSRNSEGSHANVLQFLGPVVEDIQQRQGLEDLLLMGSLIQVPSRQSTEAALGSLTKARLELQNQSVLDVLLQTFSKTTPKTLAKFVRSLHPFLEDNGPVLIPLAHSLRQAFYVNDVYPGLFLIQQTLQNARQNQDFFTALIKLSLNPQFSLALKEVAVLSQKGDKGGLQGILSSMLSLFRNYANTAALPIHSRLAPPLVIKLQHNLSSADLLPVSSVAVGDVCHGVDLNFALDDYKNPGFLNAFKNFAHCVGEEQGAEALLNYLQKSYVFSRDSHAVPKTLYAWIIDNARSIETSQQGLEFASQILNTGLHDGSFRQMVGMLPFWLKGTTGVSGQSFTDGSAAQQPPLIPLVELLHDVETAYGKRDTSKGLSVTDNNNFQSTRSKHDAVLKSTARICTVNRTSKEDTKALPQCQSVVVEQALRSQLAVWEGVTDVQAQNERIAQIVDEFLYSPVSESQVASSSFQPLPKTWAKSDFFALMEQLRLQLINPRDSQEDPQAQNLYKPLKGLLDFSRSFNANMNLYDRSENPLEGQLKTGDALAQWMVEEANRLEVIAYDYAGNSKPHVRIVSGLDRLTLIMANVDFKIEGGLELGFLGINGFTCVWRDEANAGSSYHPPKGGCVSMDPSGFESHKTLTTFFLGGVPFEDSCVGGAVEKSICIAKIRNLRGMRLPTAPANYPTVEHPGLASIFQEYPTDDCSKNSTNCFGMKTLRNLFSSIWYNAPDQFNKIMDDNGVFLAGKNNLKVVNTLMKLGALRYATRHLFGVSPDDVHIKNFFRSFVYLANSPAFEQVNAVLQAVLDPAEKLNPSQPNASGLLGAALDLLWNLDAQEQALSSEMTFYTVAAIQPGQFLSEPTALMPSILDITRGLLDPHGGRSVLQQRVGVLKSIVASDYWRIFAKALYEDSLNPNGKWHAFRKAFINLQQDDSYRAAATRQRAVVESIFKFLSQPGRSAQSKAFYEQLLNHSMDQLEAGEIEGLLQGLGKDSDEIKNILIKLGKDANLYGLTRAVDTFERLLSR